MTHILVFSSLNLLKEMPFYRLTDFQLEWENETGKQRILKLMENNGFCDFIRNSNNSSQIKCNLDNMKYYDIDELNLHMKNEKLIKILHINTRMLSKNKGKVMGFLNMFDAEPDVLLLTEIGKDGKRYLKKTFPNYQYECDLPGKNTYGGVALLANKSSYKINKLQNLKIEKTCDCTKCQVEDIWVNITNENKNYTVGVIYRHPNGNIKHFTEQLAVVINKIPKNNSCIIGGDINIDLLNISHSDILNYATLLMSFGFLPKINLPTRITEYSCTLIDHLFLRLANNDKHITTVSGGVFSDISDHLPVFLGLSGSHTQYLTRPFIRIFNDKNQEKFKNKCENHDWGQINILTDINDKYNFFQNSLISIFNESFPLVRQSRKRIKDKKWMTSELLSSIRQKHRLYKKQIKSPTPHNISVYKDYKKSLDTLLKTAEETYYFEMFKDTKDSSIKLWKCLGSVINPDKKVKQNRIDKLQVEGNYIENEDDIPDVMNNFFCTVGKDLAKEIPMGRNHHIYLKNKNRATFFLSPIDESEITKEILQMNSKKSPGPDNLSPKILKFCEPFIRKPLSLLFNSTIELAIYPTQLKIAKVLALYKKKSAYLPENYRPISLLSCIDKIFEKLLHKRFMKFIDKYKIIILQQYGFLPKHSTIFALIDVVDNIRKIIEKGDYALGIFLDLKKAFDTVDHEILLSKLDHYGFRGHSNNLIRSYLTGRSQFTVVNGKKSKIQNIETGVPQGSVLGPLFFILYINDIINCIDNGKMTLFADDTSLLLHHKNLRILKQQAEKEMKNLYEWFISNKLTLNWDKTFFVMYHTKKKRIENFMELKINDKSIKRVDYVTYLGMIIDNNLSWDKHVNKLCTNLARNFQMFYNIRSILPNYLKRQLYFSLVYSRVQYGIELYGACSNRLLKKIQTMQNKLLKVLYNLPYRTATNDLHLELDLLNVKDIYNMNILKFVYDSCNKESIKQFHDYFKPHHTIHMHNTRQQNNLYVKTIKTKYGESMIQYKGAIFWNSLHQNIQTSSSAYIFKKAVRNTLISKYTQ